MSACAILVDTNVALHFPPLEQIDWCAAAGHGSCRLLIAPILLRELEQQKIFGRTATLRGRASRTIEQLVRLMDEPDPVPLRPGVTLSFLDHEPSIDFAAHRLVREVQDDHYIASAIEHQAGSGDRTLIASNDGGMALKLRSRPVSVLRLPDALKLPAEPDPDQKELREARLEIARLQASRPKLSIRFKEGGTHRVVRNARSLASDAKSLEAIRAEHPTLPIPERPSGPDVQIAGLRAAFGSLGVRSVERYNAELPAYYADYEVYLRDLDEWIERLRLTAALAVQLVNDGSATATDVNVTLSFPAGVEILRERDWKRKPRAPDPPGKPGEAGSMLSLRTLDDVYRPPLIEVHDGRLWLDEATRTVEFSAKSLKRGCVLAADRFLLVRSASLVGRGIEVEVTITCNESDPIAQRLSIGFEEVGTDASDD